MKLLLLLLGALALLAAAPQPASAGVDDVGLLLYKKGEDILSFFRKQGDEAASSSGKQGDEAAEVAMEATQRAIKALSDETAKRMDSVVAKIGGDSTREGWSVLMRTVEGDGPMPKGTDDVIALFSFKAEQMRASGLMGKGKKARADMIHAISAQEQEFIAAYMSKRYPKLGGPAWALPDGRLMSVADNKQGNDLLRNLGWVHGKPVDKAASDAAAAELRKAFLARAAAGEVTEAERRIIQESLDAGADGSRFQQKVASLVEGDASLARAFPSAQKQAAQEGAQRLRTERAAAKAEQQPLQPDLSLPTKGLKAAGAIFPDSTELALRTAMSQSRYQMGGLHMQKLPGTAADMFKVTTKQLLGDAADLLEGGSRVGAGLVDVQRIVKKRVKSGAATPEEVRFNQAWMKQYPTGGALETPSGLLMSGAEVLQARAFIARMKSRAFQKTQKEGFRLSTDTMPFDMKRDFTALEQSWLKQAYFDNTKTRFLDLVRKYADEKLLSYTSMALRNPFPTDIQKASVESVLNSRKEWLEYVLGKSQHAGRVQAYHLDNGVSPFRPSNIQGKAREMFQRDFGADLTNLPTVNRMAGNLDPATAKFETLNPLPSKADSDHYAVKWAERVNELEQRLAKARDELASVKQQHYKSLADNRNQIRNERVTVRSSTVHSDSWDKTAWSSQMGSLEGTVRIAEEQLIALKSIPADQYATRFPPLGQMDSLLDAARAATQRASKGAERAAKRAHEQAEAYLKKVRAARSKLDAAQGDKWVNPNTGKTEEPIKVFQHARQRVEQLDKELAELAEKAAKSANAARTVSKNDPLGARRVVELANARLAAAQDMARRMDDYASVGGHARYADAFNAHRADYLAKAPEEGKKMLADIHARYRELQAKIPLMEQQAKLAKDEQAIKEVNELIKDRDLLKKTYDNISNKIGRDAHSLRTEDLHDVQNAMSWVNKWYKDTLEALARDH